MKTGMERSVEALTWAAVVIWIGFALIVMRPVQDYIWLIVLVLGIILLASAIYQRSRGWHTSLMIWVAGVWMAVFAIIEVADELVVAISGGDGLGIDLWVYLGIALMSMGVAFVMRYINAPRIGAMRGSYEPRQRQPRSPIPRRIDDDRSAGYLPPAQQQAPPPAAAEPPRAVPADRRRSRRAQEPEDLESRVDDIIRRSREKRDRTNLPY